MLRWLGGKKTDHPLGDEKGLREVLGALPGADAFKTLEELRHWVAEALSAEGLDPDWRAELLQRLDDAAQPHQRKLARDYLADPQLARHLEARLWGALSGFWTDLAKAYAALLERATGDGTLGKLKQALPALAMRSLRAWATHLKWHALHYEAGSAEAWQGIGRVVLLAEARGVLATPVPVAPGVAITTTAGQELKRALLLAMSSTDCLPALEIELVDRISAHFSDALVISDTQRPHESHYWIDLGQGGPPKRLVQSPAPAPGLRFLATHVSLAEIDRMIGVVGRGGVPADLPVGELADAARVLHVLRHLRAYWGETPPVRKNDRYAVQHRLIVMSGFERIVERVGREPDPLGEDPDTGTERWDTVNVSAGGVSAELAIGRGDWIGIGQLVGLQVEGGSGNWSVGVVRRCTRLPGRPPQIGVQTFAKETFDVHLGRGRGAGLLLADSRALGEEVILCMGSGLYDARNSLPVEFGAHSYLLMPAALVKSGEDYELGRYRVLQQS